MRIEEKLKPWYSKLRNDLKEDKPLDKQDINHLVTTLLRYRSDFDSHDAKKHSKTGLLIAAKRMVVNLCPESLTNIFRRLCGKGNRNRKRIMLKAYDRKYSNSVDFVRILKKLQHTHTYCRSNSTTL